MFFDCKKSIIALILLLAIHMPAACFAIADKTSISIIINPKSSINDQSIEEIRSRLSEHKNIDINIFNLDDINLLSSNNTDYAISLGEAPAKKILLLKPEFPVIFTYISEDSTNDIISKNDQSNYYVISMIQPALRKLRIASKLLNKKAIIGLTQGNKTEKLINQYRLDAKKLNLDVIIKTASKFSEPIDAMNEALQESDLYIATYDPDILSRHSIKWLLYLAYKKNKPLIGYSAAYTKSGAVASVFSTPKQLARQCADWASNIQKNINQKTKQTPEYFTISINKRVQRSLNLDPVTSETIKIEILKLEETQADD